MNKGHQVQEASAEYMVSNQTAHLAGAGGDVLPRGFKKTEVGIIPEDWQVLSMSEMTTLMTNGFVGTAKTHYTDSNDGVIYIQGYNVEATGFNFRGIKRVTPEFHNRQSKSCLRAGDLLMIQTGDVGLTTIIPKELEGSNCHALIINRFKSKNFNSQYFCYFLNSKNGRARLKELEVGTTMKHINVGDLLHFVIPSPPTKQEQTAIANALSDVDALIAALEKLINKKSAIKTAAMQQLLTGKKRLPPFDQLPHTTKTTRPAYKQTELGEIPDDWAVKALGDLVTISSGESPSKFSFASNGIPYFKVEQLNNHSKYADITEYYFQTGNTVPAGSVIFPKRGASILLNKIRLLKNPSFMDTNLMTLTTHNELCNEFLFYFLNFKGLDSVADTTSIPQINNKHINPFLIVLPSKVEQTAIAKVLSDMDQELQALQQRLHKTQQIKQGMMQELLTGKTRLV